MRPVWRLLLALSLPWFATCGGGPRRPDVILITLDTTRADHLGCYGDTRARTPALDSLAAHGVRFTQAITPVPITTPAHASILTGRTPLRHGVRDNGRTALAPAVPLATERFRAAGYQTAAFVSAFVLERQFGLARGFDAYNDRLYNERLGRRTARAAARWLERVDPRRPIFLWVHLYDPHWPYQPVEPYRSADLPSPYAKEITQMDGAVRLLLGALRRAGRLERAVVVAAGDHGEMLGEHGEPEHGVFLYESALRVPLILCLPGRGSRVDDSPVSLIDVAPTLLEAARLPALEGIDGSSLLALAAGKPRAARPAEYCETLYPENAFAHSPLHGLRTPRWKYIRAPRPELYDLATDPREAENLHGARPDTAGALARRLDRVLESAPAAPAEAHSLSDADRERLESLGYVSDDATRGPDRPALPDPKDLAPQLETWLTARAALDTRRWEDAARGLREVLRLSPTNVIAARHLGEALQRLSRYDEAVAVLEGALREAPGSVTLARHLAIALRRAGNPERAHELYRIVADDPLQRWTGVTGMAACRLEQGRPEEARALLAEAAAGRPDAGEARQMLTLVERYLRRRTGAATASARLDWAGAAFDLGLHAEVRRALAFRSQDPATEAARHRILGSLAGATGDTETAIAEFEQARAGTPDDPYLHHHLAPLYLEANRPREALAAASRAIEIGPPNPVDFYNQACAAARLGRTDDALAALEGAIRAGYRKADRLLEDPDLASLQDDPRFTALAERAARD